MDVTLREKFFGCICGCQIGSAMGAPVEGMSYGEITDRYGFVDHYLPYQHYGNGWDRVPGTTEDGVERQKLMISAIIDKQGRVTAEDVRTAWNRYANPNAGGWVSEPFEGTLLKIARTGIPAIELGRYCDYAGLNSFARACHPIGLINAGNIDTAIEDVLQVGQLYQTTNSRGLKWACVTGVAIAEGTKPQATVDSVIGAIFDYCDPDVVVREIEEQLRLAEPYQDIFSLRKHFDSIYNGFGMPYPFSYANEVVTKGVVIFKMTRGNLKEAILAGVNMGRDTDCVAAVAGGIAGALSGTESIPQEWIDQLDAATLINPYTNSKRTLRESSDELYMAFKEMLHRNQKYISTMDIE